MASRRGAQRKPRALKQRDQGTLRSIGRNAAIRSEISQKIIVEVSRKKDFKKSEEAHAFYGSKRVRTKALERRLLHLQQAKYPMGRQYVPSSLHLPFHIADLTKAPLRPQTLHKHSKLHQKHKRGREAGHTSAAEEEQPPSKRPRISPPHCTVKGELQREAESDFSKNNVDSVETWVQTKRWPSEYFKQGSQARENLFKHDSWLEEQMEQPSIPIVQYVEINGIKYPRPTQKVQTSVRRRPSETSLTGSSNQKKNEGKIAPYRDNRYTMLLAAKGSYMKKSDLGISDTSRNWCTTLLNSAQTVPEDSPFRDDKFEKTCGKIEDRNEARVIQDIARLIVPSAENLATDGARHLDHLIENVDEAWTEGIPVEGPRPQPDYSVGFRRSAFTGEQLKRLDPFIGSVFDTSFFVATYRMYFPFLTCEVKCGTAALDIADRQNAHSMTLAVRGVVNLFRLVKREKELHREILAFSLSHDHRAVRIYGHYPVIDGDSTAFYRHPIHEFSFTALDGKDKWTSYKFTKNVYEVWMPTHLKRICSVIDKLPPNVDFEVAQGSEIQFPEASGPSQKLCGLLSESSNVDSGASQDDSELVPIIPQMDTPDTSDISRSQGKDQLLLKRPKRKHTAK